MGGSSTRGRISWQASTLNFISRHLIKRSVARNGLSPASVRSMIGLIEMLSAGFGGARARRLRIGGLACDVIAAPPGAAPGRVLLYLHGGGFFAHLPRSYRRFAQRLAAAYGATVYLPAYRLAPEHRFPAATDDCMAFYRALLAIGCDPRQLCLMGDSAGGNLALVTLQRARDEGLPLPACATVISPSADLSFSGASFSTNAEADPFIPVAALHQVAHQYVDAGAVRNPQASPMLGNFRGLPPLQIVVGSTEVLLDDARSTADACRAAGVQVELRIWQKMPHVFPLFGYLPEGRAALRQMRDFFLQYVPLPQ